MSPGAVTVKVPLMVKLGKSAPAGITGLLFGPTKVSRSVWAPPSRTFTVGVIWSAGMARLKDGQRRVQHVGHRDGVTDLRRGVAHGYVGADSDGRDRRDGRHGGGGDGMPHGSPPSPKELLTVYQIRRPTARPRGRERAG
jgi:hypothetical protein